MGQAGWANTPHKSSQLKKASHGQALLEPTLWLINPHPSLASVTVIRGETG